MHPAWYGSSASPSRPAPQRVTVDRNILRTADGQPFRIQFIDRYVVLRAWRDRDFARIDALVEESLAVGANGWDIFSQWYWMDYPAVTPFVATPQEVRELVEDVLAPAGLYANVRFLADNGMLGLNGLAQAQRCRELVRSLNGLVNVFGTVCNEAAISDNAFDPSVLQDPIWAERQFLMDTGYYPVTGQPGEWVPTFDVIANHPPRKPTWTIEAAKNAEYQYRQTGKPSYYGEPPKFAPPDNPDGEADEHDVVTSPRRAEEGMGGAALAGCGYVFHCWSGIHAQPLSSLEYECASAGFAMMARVPTDAPLGTYVHDGAGAWTVPVNDDAVLGELAGRQIGDTQYLMEAMPSPGFVPTPAAGVTMHRADPLIVLTR